MLSRNNEVKEMIEDILLNIRSTEDAWRDAINKSITHKTRRQYEVIANEYAEVCDRLGVVVGKDSFIRYADALSRTGQRGSTFRKVKAAIEFVGRRERLQLDWLGDLDVRIAIQGLQYQGGVPTGKALQKVRAALGDKELTQLIFDMPTQMYKRGFWLAWILGLRHAELMNLERQHFRFLSKDGPQVFIKKVKNRSRTRPHLRDGEWRPIDA